MCRAFQLATALHCQWPPKSSCEPMPGQAINILQVHADQVERFPRLSSSKSAHSARKLGNLIWAPIGTVSISRKLLGSSFPSPDPTTPRSFNRRLS